MSRNIFEPTLKNTFRKTLNLFRLNLKLKAVYLRYIFNSATKRLNNEEENMVNYYYLTLINSNSFHRQYKDCKFYFSDNTISFVARAGTQFSDLESLNQIFGRNEYKVIVDLYKKNFHSQAINIVDAGANVGYATLYFYSHFHNAQFLCFEPDKYNYLILKENCVLNDLKKAQLIDKAVWNKDCYLEYKDKSSGTWGFSFCESAFPTNIIALDLKKTLKEHEVSYIDILKIDIEGAESVLFEENNYMKEILGRTKVIAIEIHDKLANRENITTQLEETGFALSNNADITIGINCRLSKFFKYE